MATVYDMARRPPSKTDGARSDIGQLGRVAVIGGSEDYTGAPYFSAMASARLGCDLVSPVMLAHEETRN